MPQPDRPLAVRARARARRLLAARRRRAGYAPSTFCLVTGSYRSGTSAVVQWLGEQEGVVGFNESRVLLAAHALLEQAGRYRVLAERDAYFTEAARSLAWGYYAERCRHSPPPVVVDKEPLGPIELPDGRYDDFLASVRRLAPGVRLLVMVRDPLETVWSMTRRSYGYSLTGQPLRDYPLADHVANWCRATELAARLVGDPAVHVCSFGLLTREPEAESRRVAAHLGLAGVATFAPRPTAAAAFAPEERELVLSRTRPAVEALAAAGVPL